MINKNITIETARLSLRELRIRDISDSYITSLNDYEVVRYTEARHRKWDRISIENYVGESLKSTNSLLLGIFFDNQKHIGNIHLMGFNSPHFRCELGIIIFDKKMWSKGIGFEALLAVTSYLLKSTKINRICADYYSANHGSAKIFHKCGYKIEGVFKEHLFLEGKFMDSIRVAKLKSDMLIESKN